MTAADPGGGHSGHVPPPPPPPFIYKFITFRAAFYNIAARLRCLLISARMNSTTVLYPGPPDTRSYSPPRPSYRARNRQHPPPPPPPPPPRFSYRARSRPHPQPHPPSVPPPPPKTCIRRWTNELNIGLFQFYSKTSVTLVSMLFIPTFVNPIYQQLSRQRMFLFTCS